MKRFPCLASLLLCCCSALPACFVTASTLLLKLTVPSNDRPTAARRKRRGGGLCVQKKKKWAITCTRNRRQLIEKKNGRKCPTARVAQHCAFSKNWRHRRFRGLRMRKKSKALVVVGVHAVFQQRYCCEEGLCFTASLKQNSRNKPEQSSDLQLAAERRAKERTHHTTLTHRA